MDLTRRNFIKLLGAGAAAVAFFDPTSLIMDLAPRPVTELALNRQYAAAFHVGEGTGYLGYKLSPIGAFIEDVYCAAGDDFYDFFLDRPIHGEVLHFAITPRGFLSWGVLPGEGIFFHPGEKVIVHGVDRNRKSETCEFLLDSTHVPLEDHHA